MFILIVLNLKTLEGKESRNDKLRSSPPPERQSYLDNFVGESIGSDENGINDDIKDNENSKSFSFNDHHHDNAV